MPKRKYALHDDVGKFRREHDEKVLAAIREIMKQEEKTDQCYTDSQISNMVCDSGLLTNKGRIYNMRLSNGIPNISERRIINFGKKHKKN